MAWPVCRRTNSGAARPIRGTPRSPATRVSSTRWAPLVITSSGLPSTSNTRLFAIAPTGTPSWAAAAAAVRALSGRWRTVPAAPAARSRRATSATRGCSGSVGGGGGGMGRSCHRAGERAAVVRAVTGARTARRHGGSVLTTGSGSGLLGPVRTSVRTASLLRRPPAFPARTVEGGGARCAGGGEAVMSRVLGELAGRVGEEVQVERGPLGPVQFWRGQSRYLVGELLDSWVETAPWWRQDTAAGGASAELVSTQEVWRVEAVRAGRSRTSFAGVYDLTWDAAGNRWWLVRVHD